MKKTVSLLLVFVCLFLAATQMVACDLIEPTKTTPKNEHRVTIHYYEGITRTYTVYDLGTLKGEILSPSGYVIMGLFDESGVQYAMNDCVINSWNENIPTVLYARYKKVEKKSYTLSAVELDEDPKTISFYKSVKSTWNLNIGDQTEAEIINICKCNPYADLTITAKFMGKGVNSQKYSSNVFKYKVCVNEEAIGTFTSENLGSNYTEHTVTATIKAKQLMNAGYEIITTAQSSLGYEDYVVKNLGITISFEFEE